MLITGSAIASTVGGVAVGGAVGDMLGAWPVREATVSVPASTGAATPRKTADGKIVSGGPTAKQSLWTSAFIVLGAMAILVFGDRILKDARIG